MRGKSLWKLGGRVAAIALMTTLLLTGSSILVGVPITPTRPALVVSPGPLLTLQNPNPDPNFADGFGRSVTVVGSNILVGAPSEFGGSPDGGAAYLFDGTTGGPPLLTIPNPTPAVSDFFGISVAAVGGNILVGAPGDDTAGNDAGAVYLFDTAGTLLRTFLGPSEAASFGVSVAAVGTNILVGAPVDDTGAMNAGAAYLFDTNGNLLQRFQKNPPVAEDSFGISVAAVNGNVLIGAHRDDTAGTDAGAAYLFDGDPLSPTFGALLQTFPNPNPNLPSEAFDIFGLPVVGLGSDILVGASQDQTVGPTLGAAYLFDGDPTSPTFGDPLHTFPPPPVADHFGASMAAVGENVLIGAFRDDTAGFEAGAAYLFDRVGNLLLTFVNPNPDPADEFAFSVAAFNGNVVIGAFRDDAAGSDDGVVYVFEGAKDIDQDGIPDVVELNGLFDFQGTLLVDMPMLGADPCRKTVAVDVDYMHVSSTHSHRPRDLAIAEAVEAFNVAPVAAVDPCPYVGFPTQALGGVNLIVDIDDSNPIPEPEVPELTFGSAFDAIKAANFEEARAPYFHYSLWVHDLEVGSSVSGIAEMPGNDFIVSLGSWTGFGTIREQSGTFMHELGHNLGLDHGGGDPVNGKPNYLSVMNHHFQPVGIYDGATGVQKIDYSREELNPLDELSLDETIGIGDGTLWTVWRDLDFNLKSGQGNGPLDWTGNDADGNTIVDDDFGVHVDINGDGVCVDAGADPLLETIPDAMDEYKLGATLIHTGPDRVCHTMADPTSDDTQVMNVGDTQPNPLTGYDDWANLQYSFTGVPSYATGVHLVPDESELTFEDAQAIEAFWQSVIEPEGLSLGWIIATVLAIALLLAVVILVLWKRRKRSG